MTGSATVSVNPLPGSHTLTGGGNACSATSGVDVGLNGSDGGINYQLYNGTSTFGSSVSGSGSALDFGDQTTSGTYTVVATDATTGCTLTMSGSASVTINPTPTAYTISSGGNYCSGGAGVDITLGGSANGVNYQLYNGTSTVGSAVSGNGSTLDFGNQTSAGSYTVVATDATSSCTNNMTGSATVSVNPLPGSHTLTGGGNACSATSGVDVGLNGSDGGINYQLYNGTSTFGSSVSGSGSALDFGDQTTSGTYTVVATDATTGCTLTMSGSASVTINPTPTAYTISSGGNYCSGGAGVDITLGGSANGVNYQLYNGTSTVGSAVSGNGSTLDFGNQTTAGSYTVVATDATSSCTNNMTGSATVSVNPLPNSSYSISGDGSYCAGGSGVDVSLSNSDGGINYQLYNGTSTVGSPMSGSGSSIDFGNQTAAGTYTILAIDATTSCTNTMTGTATITIITLPTAYSLTGGGNYCAGGAGVDISLSGSASSINYQLYDGTTTEGSTVSGTGSSLDFGSLTDGGTYTVIATDPSTSCTNTMTGSVNVTVLAIPTSYTMSGDGNYCSGGAGVDVSLGGSDDSVNYQLYNGTTAVGSLVPGTGSSLDFGNQTAAGTYTIVANPGVSCATTMTGSATISINPLPTAYSLSGGGNYCSGGSGLDVSLGNSDAGINYQLYDGTSTVGTSVSGATGTAIDFGNQTGAGTYSVIATDATTSCTQTMTGTPTVIIDSLPTIYTIGGGGNYCSGGSGRGITLSGSQTGINYQLFDGTSTEGSAMSGSGSSLSFGNKTDSGTYTIVATNATTSCVNNMSGSVNINIDSLPVVHSVTGGGNYCSGGSGVDIALNGSETGFTYQLYYGTSTVGSSMSGSGSALDFGNQTSAGVYTVVATSSSTSCTDNMNSSATVFINPLPNAYTMSGGGTDCATDAGLDISLSNSDDSIHYQLYVGTSTVGSATTGVDGTLDFGLETTGGTYTVVATNPSTSCVNNMNGSATITVLATPTVYTVTGGGNYCSGGAGLDVALSSSNTSVNYQLYNDGSPVGFLTAGTGTTLDFGSQTAAGTYSVIANPGYTCATTMSSSVTVSIDPLPTPHTVSGGGSFCAGGDGEHIYLNTSDIGFNYQLYNGTGTVGIAMPGTTAALDFGALTAGGTYHVVATNTATSCTNNMSNTVGIVVNPLPTLHSVTGGGGYCSGGAGEDVALNGSDTGVNYQLYNGGSMSGSAITGTSSAIDFGFNTSAGTYTVIGTNATTGCFKNMTGSAVISVNTAPTAYSVMGGGSFCVGGTGADISLNGSNTGVQYQLHVAGSTSGGTVTGTGVALDLGMATTTGTYTVTALNTTTGCTNTMLGSATVTTNPLPASHTVTGGGNYCAGGTGADIGLDGSDAGINYTLYNGTAIVDAASGSSTAIDYGFKTAAGTYTVKATDATTGCTSNMAGSAVVGTIALPTAYIVGGGGSYCFGGSGLNITLSNSTTGVSYQLLMGGTTVGSPIAGTTSSSISFGSQPAAGNYTVMATNGSGCTNNMTGSATIAVNPLPVSYVVTGGGSYCSGGSGVAVGLSASNTGIRYTLSNGTTSVGSPVEGTGIAISFGLQTASATYTVTASDESSTCTNNMYGSAVVTMNATPVAYAVSGGGNYCPGGSGVDAGLTMSDAGVNYQLNNGSITVGFMAGSGSSLDFGLQTAPGTYTVLATDATTFCTNNMTGSAVIGLSTPPTVYAVTGGGAYCSGSTGVAVGIAGSNSTVKYQLHNGSSPVGVPVTGTGTAMSFGPQTTTGSYTVTAIDATSTCSSTMSGSASISVNPLPGLHTVTGGGSFCSGGSGAHVGLFNSSFGINYQLYLGSSLVGAPMPGTGTSIDFGPETTPGTYTVVGSDATTSCTNTMTGSATIAVNPAPTAYTVTGGGNYCAGGTGVNVGLGSSDIGFTYQLYNGSSPIGAPISGTGTTLNFGPQTTIGSYSVVANSSSSCSGIMTGTVVVSLYSLPAVYNVSGGGSYCSGGTGVSIGLTGSSTGVNYQLSLGGVATGSPIAGTGLPLDFGLQTGTGSYSVIATSAATTCSTNMSGTPAISLGITPAVHSITGGGNYCVGGSGVHLGLDGSDAGVTYQLYNSTAPVGSVSVGTGASIDFGVETTPGIYTVIATSSSSTCTNTMLGSRTIAVSPLPAVYSVTGGGNYCAGGSGSDVALSGSDAGVNYQLFISGAPLGSPVTGSGPAIDFGLKTTAGFYTVIASNPTTTCTNTMIGGATIAINPAPSSYTVGGGGAYCAGGTGVHVMLSGSTTGVSYQLSNAGGAIGVPVTGAGFAVDFGLQTAAGAYTVVATNATTGCTANMSGSTNVVISPLPVPYTISGAGSNYCAGGAGIDLLLSGSQTGVNYQLYNSGTPTGTTVTGTGSTIDFGFHMPAGIYSVIAVNTTTTCSQSMAGSASITVNPLPLVYSVIGGGNYCNGGAGVHVGLSGSNAGIKYQLYIAGIATGAAISGTGSPVDFGMQTTAGNYTVVASNSTTSCSNNMSGMATVVVNPLPAAHSVTGGGNYCGGGTGVHVGLSGSAMGISYQLFKDGAVSGSPMAGTGFVLDFGLETAAGTYSVIASDVTTTCANAMAGSATVAVNPLPTVYPVTGSGNFCAGGTGLHVGISGSGSGIAYRLYNGGSPVGSPMIGSGTGLDFGSETTAGTYTVIATDPSSSCTNNMAGSAIIVVNALPGVYHVVGGGGYCAGGTGVHIGLSNSNSGVNYQLYDGFASTGGVVLSAGGPLDLGLQTTAGTYTVIGVNASTGCTSTMADSAVVVINTMVAPHVNLSTGVGDTVCAGNMITFTATPVNGGTSPTYQWTVNGAPTGTSNTYSYLPANGDIIGVAMTSSLPCAVPPLTSSELTISVLPNEMPSITSVASPGNVVCQGTTVTYSAAITYGGSAPAYQWYVNGAPGSTASSFSYVPANTDNIYCTLASNYHCSIASTATSNHIAMEVDVPGTPVVTIGATPGLNIANGQTLTLSATITSATLPSIQWFVNGVAVSGATGMSFTNDNYSNNDEVTCQVTNGGGCAGTQGSASVTIHIDNVGVKQISSTASDVQLIPNPNKGTFMLKGTMGATSEEVSLEITNMLGQVIYTNKVMTQNGVINEKVQLGNSIANGMYILNLRSGAENKVFHMVIEQ